MIDRLNDSLKDDVGKAAIKAILVHAIRVILQYDGTRADIWSDPVVKPAVVSVSGLLGIWRVQTDTVMATGVAIAYRLWYVNLDTAIQAFAGKRRTIGKRSGHLTRVLEMLGANAGLSSATTMRALVSVAIASGGSEDVARAESAARW